MTITENMAVLARSAATVPTAASDPAPGANLIINGGMTVSQRGTSFAGLGAADFYTLDRWYQQKGSGSETLRVTVSQESAGGVGTNKNWLKMLCTTADASLGATDAFRMHQLIEGYVGRALVTDSSADLAASAVSMDIIAHADGASSITFPAKVGLCLQTADGTAREYVTDITIAAADTWERVTFAIPSDATAFVNNSTGTGPSLIVTIAGGSSRQTASEDAWTNTVGDYVSADSDNFCDATNNYVGITDVKWEVGSTATAFQHEPYGDVLARCHRYYEKLAFPTDGSVIAAATYSQSASSAQWGLMFSIKRATPTFVVSAAAGWNIYDGGAATLASISCGEASLISCRVNMGSSGSTWTAGNAGMLRNVSGQPSTIEIISEL